MTTITRTWMRKNGTTVTRTYDRNPRKKTPEELFFFKVDKTNTCWLWTGCITGKGYGAVTIHQKRKATHRWSWEYHRGEIPPGMMVLHTCDVRHCCNPEHLFLGTAKDNTQDMLAKGRGAPGCQYGENNPKSRVTWDEVREMRDLHATQDATQRELAEKFGISQSAVSYILNKKTWR